MVFFLEERSAEALLEVVLPRLFPSGVNFRCIVFEGKQDLERQLVRRMRGYRVPGARFVVLRDQDTGDCVAIKQALRQKCMEARHPEAIVRIACRELESWYLADLVAVETGLGVTGLRSLQLKAKYRSPDTILNPSRELMRLAPSYQKIGGSRAIGPHLDLTNTRSRSYANFLSALNAMATRSRKGQGAIHGSHGQA